MADQSGYPYPNPALEPLTAMRVVVDDDDRPIMAAAARPILEMFVWCGKFERPHAALHALRLLHDDMAPLLKAKGWSIITQGNSR